MIHIHPFPARMAPEIALKGLEDLPQDYRVLDPMSGSGMVLGTAAKLGLSAVGYDVDPLACMISRANGRFVDETRARHACEQLISQCKGLSADAVSLPWIDADDETRRYIDFWFAPRQQAQLRVLSSLLVAQPFIKSPKILDILKIAVSRLIITKEPKASLARDTAHSRPHKTIAENDFDIFGALPKSLDHVLAALQPAQIRSDVKTYRGDARRMRRIRDCSVDCIVTSPPYLNAIDYMRGHRLSLVWLGYSVVELRKVRARSIGAEIADNRHDNDVLRDFFSKLNDDIKENTKRILARYYRDLRDVTCESFRVLKKGARATYVIGNSNIKGNEIKNSELLMAAATASGFETREISVRVIPENKRYMPVVNSRESSLAKRMREEHVVVLEKPS